MTLRFRPPPVVDSSGEARSLSAQVLREACQLWASLSELPVTAEAVGWLSLLSKTLNVAHELVLNDETTSAVGLAAAERLALEVHTQLHTVCRPLSIAGDNFKADQSTQETRRILRMYVAWCILQERELVVELSDKRALNDIFERQTVRDFGKSLGAKREEYERHFGPISEDSGQELALDRKRMEAALAAEKHELETLVETLNLQAMLKRLETSIRSAQKKTKKRGMPSFPAAYAIMHGEPLPTVRQQFAQARVGFVYGWYSRDSLQLHGSSLNLSIDNGSMGPRLTPTTTTSTEDLARIVRDVLFRLAILRDFLPA